nr:alpha/beta hydrolase [uncultured Psychroserpens sp.]
MKHKKLTTLQKTGAFFIITGALITLGSLFSIINHENELLEDLRSFITLIGCLLYLAPIYLRKIKAFKANKLGVFLIVFCLSCGLFAQDYSKQVEAFKESFNKKDATLLNPFISLELKFDPVPIENTPAVLNNIVTNLPKLNTLEIIQTQKGQAKVKYDFEMLGIRESAIHFDTEGKIIRIELIENLINQEIEAQKKLKESIQQPNPEKLDTTFTFNAIEFTANDGLKIYGKLYETDKNKPVILLCHQANYNSFEYADIAPRLNALGYNCLAIDQRSGGGFADLPNLTHNNAKEKNLATNYLNAQPDIQAAIDYLHDKYQTQIILWGSSYSSSLALMEGSKNEKVRAIIAFSPGDYFGEQVPSLASVFKTLDKPFFVTSSKQEAHTLMTLIGDNKLNNNQIQFIPELEGFHGSKALWVDQKGAEVYWESLIAFLTKIK